MARRAWKPIRVGHRLGAVILLARAKRVPHAYKLLGRSRSLAPPVRYVFSSDMHRLDRQPNASTARERVIIELSVAVLREAMARSDKGPVTGADVRLALRCLLPHCPERWPLVMFWDGGGGTNPIGRAQSCTAAFNGIVRQLRIAGKWRD